jgi:hypothetical protein
MCVDCVLASSRIAEVDPGDEPLPEVVLSHGTLLHVKGATIFHALCQRGVARSTCITKGASVGGILLYIWSTTFADALLYIWHASLIGALPWV